MTTFKWPAGGFPARYPGSCAECGGPIEPGQAIAYAGAIGPLAPVHWECPPEPPTVRPGEVSCPVCFLIHPAGECDR